MQPKLTEVVSSARLSGKVALVTGGSRGIGAAIVTRMAQDGARVAFTYSNSITLAESLVRAIGEGGGQALAILADSGNPDAVKAAVLEVIQTFGQLDILVNNAALALGGTIESFSNSDLDRMIAVNIKGVFVATQEAARYMNHGGRIINIGSSNSDFFPLPGASVYTMTKGAVAGLTKGLARELGPRGITINNVQPGPTDTEMNPANGALAAAVTGFIGVQRYAQAAEIAGAVSYLAGAEAGFVTGSNLKIDGGLSA